MQLSQTATLVLSAAGVITLLIAILLYWSFRQRSEVARERRRFAAEILEHIPTGVLLISPEGRIEFINRASERQAPFAHPLFVIGEDFRSGIKMMIDEGLVDTEGRSKAEILKLMTVVGMEDGYSREFRFADGSIVTRTTKRLQSGSTLIIREDITDHRHRQRQIETLNEELREQVQLARITNQELRAFAYATSHDLKAPTNTMIMAVDALVDSLGGRLSAEEADYIGVLRRTTQHMRALIDDILAYTNTVGGDLRREPVDLNEVARNCLDALSGEIQASHAEVSLAALPSLEADPRQMRQLLENLIGNALKFRAADRKPVVEVAAADAPSGFVGFKIKDNGIGIAPEHHAEVFQLFSRVAYRGRPAGTGLGLTICQRIVINHGGRIRLASQAGAGTCFTVILEERANDRQSHAD